MGDQRFVSRRAFREDFLPPTVSARISRISRNCQHHQNIFIQLAGLKIFCWQPLPPTHTQQTLWILCSLRWHKTETCLKSGHQCLVMILIRTSSGSNPHKGSSPCEPISTQEAHSVRSWSFLGSASRLSDSVKVDVPPAARGAPRCKAPCGPLVSCEPGSV